jgi:hypothetical protein
MITSKAVVPTKRAGEDPCRRKEVSFGDEEIARRNMTHRRVVQDGADIGVLDLIVRVERLDPVGEEFVEDEADTRSSRKLVERQIARVTVNGSAELGAELGDDLEDHVALL